MSKHLFAIVLLCFLSAGSFAAYTVSAGEDWQPIQMDRTIEPGSALDFSDRADAPAGRHGAVLATKDGHFEFEKQPGVPVRFLGANLCFSANFISKPEAEALALRFRQMGYNTLRIHHYDVEITGGWRPAAYTFDTTRLDQLDYLFHCMKKQGIYIATDLFTIRRIKAKSLAAYDIETTFQGFKALVPLLPEAMDEWKKFARDMLTHKNPYTGMTWAEDPALFSINPVNEDTLYDFYKENKKVEALTQKLFAEWCEKNALKPDEKSRPGLFIRFLTEKHLAADREMSRFLKEELGCKALLSGNNWKTYQAQTVLRSKYDYVDNHRYWDHPAWSGGPTSFPIRSPQKNAANDLAYVPRHLFLTRVMDKPFIVSEFNFCFPNPWRGQGGPLMGAYAALQGWDGLIRFNWDDGILNDKGDDPVIRGFDTVNDPVNLLSEYIIACLWQRNDLPILTDEKTFTVTDESAFAATPNGKPVEFPENASLLGLTHRIGSVYEPSGNAARLNAEFLSHKPQNRYRAEPSGCTVEIEKPGNFIARTPQSIALILQSRSLDQDFVTGFSQPSTVFCAALDSQPLEKSERLLVLHLGNVLNSNMRFADETMKTQETMGTLPLLVRRASAQLAVPNEAKAGNIQVFALNLSGKRIREIPFSVNPDSKRIEFTVQTIAEDKQTCMAYEIIRTN